VLESWIASRPRPRKGGISRLRWRQEGKGPERHLLVDTQGLVWKVKVHEAGLHDQEAAKLLLAPLAGHFPRMVKVWVDYAYGGLGGWLRGTLGWELEVVKRGLGAGGTRTAHPPSWVPGLALAVGGGPDLWVVRAEPEVVQGL
jgi:hypothetical protein